MKKFKGLSIFALIISVLACCFVFANNSIDSAYAAEAVYEDCFYLVDNDGNPYQANNAVGKVEGTGKFIVGASDVTLTAASNENYKIIGWQIIYLEQAGRTQFIDALNLEEYKKTIELTAKDGLTKTNATIEFLIKDGNYRTSTFTLENVFEDLKISPVFDHIYYSVEIGELAQIAEWENSLPIGENVLYYETAIENSGVTTYQNSYIQIENEFYYYGNLRFNGTKYYTLHKTLNDQAEEQEVEYTNGAFRVGDEIKFDLDVIILQNDLLNSKNIDFIGASVVSDSTTNLTENKTQEAVESSYKITQDNLKRTTNVAFDFAITSSKNQKNVVDIVYHNLYVADINIIVDGSTSHDEADDVFGTITTDKVGEIKSNISIYNFYSKTNDNNQQFLIKAARDNSSKSFGVVCSQTIGKSIDGSNYKYYDFVSLNDVENQSQDFANVSQNIVINIAYASTLYTLDFMCAEYLKDSQGNVTLTEIEGNVLDAISKKRGETIVLDATALEDVENVGYKFVGFAYDLNSSVQENLSYEINREKPKSETIYLCFEKIEYQIVFANYNKLNIDGVYPLNSISFTINGGAMALSQTLNSQDLVGENVVLANKIKIGSIINITQVINAGFNILGYSLKSPSEISSEDYFTTLNFDAELIEANNITDSVIIYVYEDFIKYELTYYIEPTHDNNVDENIIMAELNAESVGAIIEKYDIEDKLISVENDNLDAQVAKLVISNLNYNSQVVLKSKPLTGNDGENNYLYVFNWFTEDDKSTLSYEKVGEYYNHTETVVRSREIKVVYSMPSTKILIALEEEFLKYANFGFKYEVSHAGNVLSPEETNNNLFSVEVGVVVRIAISELAFGYSFEGYTYVEESEYNELATLSFDYETKVGINTILLDFEHVEYRFSFTQFGAGKDDEKVLFDGKDFVVLDVDNTTLQIEKPLGYYVSKVLFHETDEEYTSKLSETNEYRLNNNIQIYEFNLLREDFVNIVTNYGHQVTVSLYYEIFKYNVKVELGITNPKGDSRDEYVNYPKMELRYELDGQTNLASIDTSFGVNTLMFVGIPYAAKATLQLLNSAPLGFSLSGWYSADGSRISSDDYSHSFESLIIMSVIDDNEFCYKLNYKAYYVQVDYVSSQGNPLTYINNNLVAGDKKQITLYDKLDIVANALRDNGYVFDKIAYKTPKYTLYSYSDETWALKYNTLYVYKNEQYELNTSSVYNNAENYYVYSEEEVEAQCENNTFSDSMFLLSNYALEADGQTVTFVVQYKLLEMKIVNTITEKSKSIMWKLSAGTGRGDIKFESNDLAVFTIKAKDKNTDEEREIKDVDFVNFYDIVSVFVQINKQATNKDGTKYDLTNGLTLGDVKIGGKAVGREEREKGLYVITFNVGEHLPEGQEIDMVYEFNIVGKTVNATTVVENSSQFYQNTTIHANALKYGFEMKSFVTENNASKLTHEFQFLAKAQIYAEFNKNGNYAKYFVISGVKIYCNGVELSYDEFEQNGIVVNEDLSVDVRFFNDIDVVFMVQPKITYNNGPVFTKTFMCDNLGNGLNQQLSVGETNESDIQIDEMLVDLISIKYISVEPNSAYVDSVQNVGRYNVKLTFSSTQEFDWLNEVEIAENIVLIIQAKQIYLTYDESIESVTKVYDGTSNYNVANVYKYLNFTDNKDLNILYSTILESATNNLALANAECYISSLGKDAAVSSAKETTYNLYVYNFALKDTAFNRNFVLQNNDMIIYNFIQITKREIKLANVSVSNKVYDGTDKAELENIENIRMTNIIAGDDVSISGSRLNPKFTDSSIGTNKKVKVDALSALVGKDISNYFIGEIEIEGLKITPYSLSTTIKGLGTIEVTNRRGLTEKDKIDLIPMNAILSVKPIYEGDNNYVSIYGKISKYLKGNNEFAIGYSISFLVNGENVPIDNNLYLSVPQVKDVTGTYFLTGQKTGEINHTTENGNMLIDLSQINGNVNQIFMTKVKYLLKPWQIVLIVIGAILVVTGVVITFIIIRKRKIDRDSVHEKI